MINKRLIILNMVVSYGRSLLSVGLTLFSTRWILAALGKEDLGLYYAVGGIVLFLSFINTSMSGSAQRNFAYALGHGGVEEVRGWFNSALSLHVVYALVFLLLAVPLGAAAFRWWFSIPDARLNACHWVFIYSVITTAVSIVTVPYNAIYIARQHIFELTIIQLLQTLATFILAWKLLSCAGDRLEFYACWLAVIQVAAALVQVLRCRFAFPESTMRISEMFNMHRYRSLCYFSGLGLLTSFAYFLRSQGVAILLNNYGTSGTNAAYGIANNVSGQIGLLSRSFMNAVSPEITKLEGCGDHDTMVKLSNRSCKFSVLMILFLFVPLFTDIHPLLVLWLKNVPEYTDSFVRIMFLAFIMVHSVLGVDIAMNAYGKKLVGLSICAMITLLLAIPVAYGAILLGMNTSCIVASIAITVFLTSLNTLYFAHRIMDYPVWQWTIDVIGRNGLAAMVCFIVNYSMHLIMAESFLRLFTVGVVDAIIICCLGWLVVLSAEERSFVNSKLKMRLIRR